MPVQVRPSVPFSYTSIIWIQTAFNTRRNFDHVPGVKRYIPCVQADRNKSASNTGETSNRELLKPSSARKISSSIIAAPLQTDIDFDKAKTVLYVGDFHYVEDGFQALAERAIELKPGLNLKVKDIPDLAFLDVPMLEKLNKSESIAVLITEDPFTYGQAEYMVNLFNSINQLKVPVEIYYRNFDSHFTHKNIFHKINDLIKSPQVKSVTVFEPLELVDSVGKMPYLDLIGKFLGLEKSAVTKVDASKLYTAALS